MALARKPGKPLRKTEQRRLVADRPSEAERIALRDRVIYTGNPRHKRSPGNFALNPPASARPNKTLCDAAGIFSKRIAQALLRQAASDGLWDELRDGGFPKIVWCVVRQADLDTLAVDGEPFDNEFIAILESSDELVFEAQLENAVQGHYHGYPLLESDSYREVVVKRHAEFENL